MINIIFNRMNGIPTCILIGKKPAFYTDACTSKHIVNNCHLVEVGAWDVKGLPLLAQPAPRQSYTPIAGKAASSSHESPCQWNQPPVTLIYQWKNKGGRDGGKRMIQRLNEESGRQKKHCTEHMEVMQGRVTALEAND